MCLKTAGRVANIVDSDEMPHSAVSHLGLHCLLRSVCLDTYGKYGILIFNISRLSFFCCCCFMSIVNISCGSPSKETEGHKMSNPVALKYQSFIMVILSSLYQISPNIQTPSPLTILITKFEQLPI